LRPEDATRQLILATTNPGKIQEVRLELSGLPGWNVEPLPQGLPDIEETGITFLENAALKAIHYSRLVQGFALADDSGLCVQALDNRPGVWTARYGATPEAQNRRVLQELSELQGSPQRDATFHCAFVIARNGEVVWSREAQLQGQIVEQPVGEAGFGFDPIFFVPEMRKTLAQLTSEEKNRISARGKLLMELRRYLALP
jgi:XTP/dITP diphosphohydrolase